MALNEIYLEIFGFLSLSQSKRFLTPVLGDQHVWTLSRCWCLMKRVHVSKQCFVQRSLVKLERYSHTGTVLSQLLKCDTRRLVATAILCWKAAYYLLTIYHVAHVHNILEADIIEDIVLPLIHYCLNMYLRPPRPPAARFFSIYLLLVLYRPQRSPGPQKTSV